MKRSYSIFADYFQFYLWDKEVAPDPPTSYDEEDIAARIKAEPNVVVVQPVCNMTVPVELEVLDAEPTLDLDSWDHVAEASLNLPSGQLEIHECTGGPVDHISVRPGHYRVRAYYGRLDDLSENGLQGNDHYRLAIWPAPMAPVTVLKQFQPAR